MNARKVKELQALKAEGKVTADICMFYYEFYKAWRVSIGFTGSKPWPTNIEDLFVYFENSDLKTQEGAERKVRRYMELFDIKECTGDPITGKRVFTA